MPRCINIDPASFAQLPIDQQEAVQRQQAQCLFDLATNGNELTQSEVDYVTQILGRVPPTGTNVPSYQPSTYSNISAQAQGIASGASQLISSGLSQVSIKLLLPLIILAALVFGTVYFLRKV